ncbi:MAG TPA: hypothetical protein VFM96_02845 [Gaiellaceae bacterium]|nr:hypothetical protein [Gaiellaceae bacterium]
MTRKIDAPDTELKTHYVQAGSAEHAKTVAVARGLIDPRAEEILGIQLIDP